MTMTTEMEIEQWQPSGEREARRFRVQYEGWSGKLHLVDDEDECELIGALNIAKNQTRTTHGTRNHRR